ncbi:MAG: D-alanyl-D-alanine carboxypeptidase/D-alanyl-D-alanine-endopeptidase, partial [Planctomycetia bacterium]|nr:D-alanyl-D-alanine carboxypeptidase/D-alanyl-D-alanine-endopeptidase [Planctomycetia bacterium]
NCIDITVAPGKEAGKDARISLSPPTGYFQITGRITTTDIRKKHRYSLQRLAGKPVIKVSGKVWAKAGPVRYYRTVEDPTAFFGAVLKETFAAEGITIAGPVIRRRILNDRGKAPKGFRPVVVHTTPLLRAATVANKRSQGLYAGCIFKALAAYGGGPRGSKWPLRQGSWNAGREAVGRFNAKARLPDDGCVFDDGSGLSRKNRLTATYITELLRMMHKVHGKRWLDTLSVAGRDGTLRNRMRNTEAEGRVFGKTGYIAGVSAIAGYARSRSGGADNPLVFAIFMNRTKSLWQARKAQDAVCKALAEY